MAIPSYPFAANREDVLKRLLAAAVAAVTIAGAAWAEGKVHHVAIHVDESDARVMTMALNNAQNASAYYAAQGDEVVIELVAYGPGVQMLPPGASPVADRVKAMQLEMDNLSFSACGNTLRKMSEAKGRDLAVMEEAQVVSSGVVRLVELQEQGYACVRP